VRADDVAQQHLAVLDPATAQVVAVEMQQVESEIGEAIRPARGDRLAQRIEVRHAALVGHCDLAVEHHRGQPGCR